MFFSLSTYIPTPLAFSIRGFAVHWYGLILVIAIVAGYGIAGWLARRQRIEKSLIQTIYVNTLIWGIVGARLYHVLNEPAFYWNNPSQIPAVWNGGLAIHGALVAGALCLYYYARKHQFSFYQLADLFVLPAILGQAIGRWGNYFNQELFGAPSNLPWAIPIEPVYRPYGYEQFSHFHPTFLYESAFNLLVFILLLFVFRKKQRPQGLVLWLYVGIYSVGRIMTEALRVDRTPIIGGIRLPLMVSIALAVVGIGMAVNIGSKKQETGRKQAT